MANNQQGAVAPGLYSQAQIMGAGDKTPMFPAPHIKLGIKQVKNILTSAGEGSVMQLNNGIPIELPFVSLILVLAFRAKVTTAATAVLPDGPLGLLRRVQITGDHKNQGVGTQTLKDAQGATIDAYNRFRRGVSTYQKGTLATGVASYDVKVALEVPFSINSLRDPLEYLLGAINGPHWNNLNLNITFGGFDDLFSGGAGTVSAYGTDTGQPTVTVLRRVALLGNNTWKNFNPYFTRFIELTVPPGNVQQAGNDLLVYKLPTGENFEGILLKSYTANGGGGTAPATLLDNTLFSALRVKVDNTPYHDAIIEAQDFIETNMADGPVLSKPAGYNFIDWLGTGQLQTAFKTANFTATNQNFYLNGDVNAVANAQLNLGLLTIKNRAM